MQTTIYLIRHGEPHNPNKIVYGRLPVPLTEKGRKQIKELAEKLKNENVSPDIIISSPLKRTIETTEEIKTVFPDVPVLFEDDLQEYFGDFSDMTIDQFEALGNYYHAQETLARNIEQPESVIERMIGVMKHALSLHKDKTVFLVSHGDPIMWLFWKLTNPHDEMPSPLILHETHLLKQGTALKLVFDEKGEMLSHEIITPY